MIAGGASKTGRTQCTLAGLLCVVLVGGCVERPSTPESRATYFVEKLIREPEAIDDLRAVAMFPEDRGPGVFLDDLSVRTALVFLRARARLGAELVFHANSAGAQSPDHRLVAVSVSEGRAITAPPVALFQVELRRRDNEWMVIRLAVI